MIPIRFRISLDRIVQNPTKKKSVARVPTTRAVKCRNITQKNRKTTSRNFKIYRCQQFHHYTSEHPHRSKNPRCLQPIVRPFCTHQRDESEGPRHASWRRWRRWCRWRLASLPSVAFGAHWASAREEGKGHVEAGGRGVSSKKLGLSFVGKPMKGRFFIRFVWGFLVQI